MQRLRIRRIEEKSLELCGGGGAQQPSPARIPITIITGFLGSGKTTLVNRILTGDHGHRVLVIENEIGAISIDHHLIDEERSAAASASSAGVVVLKNGCMCCSGETPGSELERVLDKLLEIGMAAGAILPFDYVLIETSGLADPGPLMQVLWRREMATSGFYLDGVVSIVDAAHAMRHLRPAEAEKQVAVSDLVDLSDSPGALEDVSRAVEALNATAPQLRTSHALVGAATLLHLRAYASDSALELRRAAAGGAASHSPYVSCVSLESRAPLRLDALQSWLRALAEDRSDDVYRIKGVLALRGEPRRFIVHGVHAQIHGFAGSEWRDGEPRASSLVVIGHRLEGLRLDESFAACASDGESQAALTDAGECAPCEEEEAAAEGKKRL
ncbi:hypothetical protein EMIHUDRAFT_75373 [Emiliania huxleyi CCMP1516]|uniref:CobW C-terminal domain-containing protein n=2 Tax=Emiliania huxleyi TaxID=2903 RepID=A0A0D3J8D4_EMIH1|nr:hypothetical protein EMIHUDRAFT_75373 [Emiliania huxleyi CCMP1516]EOD19769.1 hypothetical protein EMIHUDRAFT_75373 [Emiliania huxleyi CCMP1516]|eukprot:XP_005772198.1 hypothetical protein EMIHUDRAFT_75373 [Emiliania huxleyi CCMP1516]